MENFSFDKDFSLHTYFPPGDDGIFRNGTRAPSPDWDPLGSLPDPLRTDIEIPTTSPSSQTTKTVSPTLTEEEEAHVDNFITFGIDSPVLPPGFKPSPPAPVAAVSPEAAFQDLSAALHQYPNHVHSTPSASTPPVSSAFNNLFSPVATFTSPPPMASQLGVKRRSSSTESSTQERDPTPGASARPAPSECRPTKRQCTSFPGESSFQLDPNVSPLAPVDASPGASGSSDPQPPLAQPRGRAKYAACKCPGGLTSKPKRHWNSCPYNPDKGKKPHCCEICGKKFGRKDNGKRHMKEYHQTPDS